MLKKCTRQDFDKNAEFAYELALVPSKSSYPTYNDGIKTKEMFLERAEKAFSRDTEDILLFEHNVKTEGWIHYYCIPENKYLSAVSFNINSDAAEAMREFLDFARAGFRGYDLYLGYPAENEVAADFLSSHGFECIESSYNNTAFLEKHRIVPISDEIVPITKENYGYFRTLHAEANENMYWNCDRIYADLENWTVFVKITNGEPVGAVCYTMAGDGWFEIFGTDIKDGVNDPDLLAELVNAALNDAKVRGGRFMTWFCGEENLEAAKRSNFMCVGKYVCYMAHLDG